MGSSHISNSSTFFVHIATAILSQLATLGNKVFFDNVLEDDPKDGEALVNKSDAPLKLGKYKESLKAAEKALKFGQKMIVHGI